MCRYLLSTHCGTGDARNARKALETQVWGHVCVCVACISALRADCRLQIADGSRVLPVVV